MKPPTSPASNGISAGARKSRIIAGQARLSRATRRLPGRDRPNGREIFRQVVDNGLLGLRHVVSVSPVAQHSRSTSPVALAVRQTGPPTGQNGATYVHRLWTTMWTAGHEVVYDRGFSHDALPGRPVHGTCEGAIDAVPDTREG